jgi:hypothetical protein
MYIHSEFSTFLFTGSPRQAKYSRLCEITHFKYMCRNDNKVRMFFFGKSKKEKKRLFSECT